MAFDPIRVGCCCATWPKPCSYHEGWEDGQDALAPVVDAARAVVARFDAGFRSSRDVDPLRRALLVVPFSVPVENAETK